MKKQQFTVLEKLEVLQIVGGIVDPDKDPDADHAGAPVTSGDTPPSDETPGRKRPTS